MRARTLDQLPYEVLDAGRALRQARQPGDRVISRKAHIAYYGDCEPLAFPFVDSLSQLARYAHANGVRWLYFSWPEAETRPKFYYLLDTAGVVPGLRPIYSAPTRPAVVYEIQPGFGATPGWMANDTLYSLHMLRARTHVDSTNPKLFTQLAMVSWWLGHDAEARDALLQATALDPAAGAAFDLLGRVDVALGDYSGARDAYGRAMELEPRDPNTRVGFGLAAFLLGRDREAAEAWRPVISYTIEPRVLRAMSQLFDSLGDAPAAAQARARLATAGAR